MNPRGLAVTALAVILMAVGLLMTGFLVAKILEPPAASFVVHYPELPGDEGDPVEPPGHDGPSDHALDCLKPGHGRPWCGG